MSYPLHYNKLIGRYTPRVMYLNWLVFGHISNYFDCGSLHYLAVEVRYAYGATFTVWIRPPQTRFHPFDFRII